MNLPASSGVGEQYLTLQGLTFFVFDNYTVPFTGLNDLPSQANTPAGLQFTDPTGVVLNGDVLHGTTGVGVAMSTDSSSTSGLTGNEIVNSLFYDIGSLAWSERGGSGSGLPGPGDNDSNTISGLVVQSDVFEGTQPFLPGGIGACGAILQSHGTTVNDTRCDDGYNGGFDIGVEQSGAESCATQRNVRLENTTFENSIISNIGHGTTQDFGCVHSAAFLGVWSAGRQQRLIDSAALSCLPFASGQGPMRCA